MNDFIIENGILIKYTGNERNIVIPDEVTEIGKSAFYSCLSVTSVKLHNKITKIGDSAFSDCAALEKSTPPSASSRRRRSEPENGRLGVKPSLPAVKVTEFYIRIGHGLTDTSIKILPFGDKKRTATLTAVRFNI